MPQVSGNTVRADETDRLGKNGAGALEVGQAGCDRGYGEAVREGGGELQAAYGPGVHVG